jgi:glutathione S-transferase
LLEELSIEYDLKLYARDKKQHRAPPEMASVQQLGKAPILVTSDGRAIAETSAIVAYLLKTYDTAGNFASEDWIKDETLTSFAGATMGPVTAIELLFDIMEKQTPFPFTFITRKIRKGIQGIYTAPEFKKALTYLESELGDSDWFNGKSLGRADIMLSWPMDTMHQRGWVDFEHQYPKIGTWRKRIQERDAWKRGIEKGNGYDLTTW